MMTPARIGELAAEFQLNPRTIRYYEHIGLLPPAGRTSGGYRHYDDRDRIRLRFITQAKTVGLTLNEIKGILDVRERGDRPCTHVAGLVDDKLADVERQLRALAAFREELLALREAARHPEDCAGEVCGLIERHACP
ncbi:heavy metal-responsive transcriptional regulator [Deinococcus taklimakanensis]|uniref:Heavy metal-responsive transcriptional regulator n=1 Tax=Deinococcus taklimakanensis TaxID=536443 RepID=A0ABW5P7B1_9DEIO